MSGSAGAFGVYLLLPLLYLPSYFLNVSRNSKFLLGFLIVKVVYPFLSKQIEKIPYEIGEKCFVVLLIFMCLNMFVSWTAIIRQSLRRNGVPPYTALDRVYDKYYTDERLARAFPNMRFK